ncbi:Osmotically-inducible protein OsmY, contains BON domain [Chitinophaga sp. YR627]|uniref:BON domain-containing protein n=1 Tax=Chitinophaga sp. YR627 TaxID=1881041 RepID=UPI0008E9A969|nr:BON domain-containing protein [Chitinophaga sp. YR627]SFM71312.1 Osmotically-inducible protein OsmY, contains BON domain [Chitinophaga sp. YR627]
MKTDLQLQQDVMDELLWDPTLEAAEIGVAVSDGVVTLSGTVNSYTKKLAAEKAAKRVKDVQAVAMDISVHFFNGESRSDTDIAHAGINALSWSTVVPKDHVTLKVENGWITLEGELDWQYQRQAAENLTKDLQGVKGITNLIRLKEAPTERIVKDIIKKALERSAEVEAAAINIITEGHRVILKGRVRSWGERSEVEKAVWAAPGVTEVRDELIIAP